MGTEAEVDHSGAEESLFAGNSILSRAQYHNADALQHIYEGYTSRSRPLRQVLPKRGPAPSKKYEWLTGTEIAAAVEDSIHEHFGKWIVTAGHGKTGALRPTGPDRSGTFDRQRFAGAMTNYLREKSYRLAHVTPDGLMKLMIEEGAALVRQHEAELRQEEHQKTPPLTQSEDVEEEKIALPPTATSASGTKSSSPMVDIKSPKSFIRKIKQRHYHPSHELVTEQEQLRFYALYQQAVKGPCTDPEPPAHEADALEKWKAHKSVSNMTKAEAEEYYCEMLKQSPTCLLLDKIYDDAFRSREETPSGSALCTYSTDPGRQ